jgi:hypothetical protein
MLIKKSENEYDESYISSSIDDEEEMANTLFKKKYMIDNK